MCSPRRLAIRKFYVTYSSGTSNPHNSNGSRTFSNLSRLLFLAIIFTSFVVLLHNDVRLLQITDNSKPSSGPSTKLGISVHSPTCPLDQRTMYKHLHASSLLIISKSMDVHPNPGPTAIHILKEFTRPEQRLLFNKVKRLLTRYEQHRNNYTYYYKNNIIPKGLFIKCRPNIDAAFYELFYQQWKLLLTATSRKMIILLKQECQKHLKLLRSEFNQTLDQPRSQCSTLTFRQIEHFLKESACELSRELHSRHRKKLSASTGECVPLAFIRTRHNNSNHRNRSNRPQILVNSSHSPLTTSTNHVNDQSINHITTTVNHPTPTRNPTVSSHPVINTPDHSTPISSRIRRRKRKTKSNSFGRRDL